MLNREYEINPIAETFPAMDAEEIKELTADIEKHGLREQVQLDAEGKILDGRSRYEACKAALRGPKQIGWKPNKWRGPKGPEQYIAFAVSKNLRRRHRPMTVTQRAQIVVELYRQFLKGPGRPPTAGNLVTRYQVSGQETAFLDEKRTSDIAEETKVSLGAVQKARLIARRCKPETVKSVTDGTMSARQALAEIKPAEFDVKDELGNVLPDKVADAYQVGAEKLAEAKRRLEAVRRECESWFTEKWPFAAWLNDKALNADLTNAIEQMKRATPYAMCPKCKGAKCEICHKTGMVPKEVYGRIKQGAGE